ncbi:hypothetical protein Poli38472_008572 [Pythium oligandrum]|uniref:Uncharacterized protein n=1 Tax=Pythium oligandrum TaxID=41045 RepID=A0A8K1C3T8_PYTOL|nr:hypothetical protein Poli38472_008572 [Pythium oligandrum]|eukprot:TMW55924.1 hypothetical protein Poli38472_008572 [Pythium oligandrum]
MASNDENDALRAIEAQTTDVNITEDQYEVLTCCPSQSPVPGASVVSLKRRNTGAVRSCANAVVSAVERAMLRSLAFVLYHLKHDQARYCVNAMMQWYRHLHAQLPHFAVSVLESFATSLTALSDAEFARFWLALLENTDEIVVPKTPLSRHSPLLLAQVPDLELERLELEEPSPSLLRSWYQPLLTRFHSLVGFPRGAIESSATSLKFSRRTQTPLTSPSDPFDDSYYRPIRRTNTLTQLDDQITLESGINEQQHDVNAVMEPGWAVQYIEAESRVPTEMTRRMQLMMHSTVPLNLFRVEVLYPTAHDDDDDDDVASSLRFLGAVSPESFPPTPITRDLQTRRIRHYTATVLDHATLALRLLETNM